MVIKLETFSGKILYFSLFLSYFLSGNLLSNLSFHSQVIPIWIPAGIALVGTYFWGWRFLPGVFVASCAFNLSVTSNLNLDNLLTNNTLSIAIIAFGTTTQAAVGGLLLRYWLGNPVKQPSYKKIIYFIVIVGLLVNLISANIGIYSLTLFNAQFSFNEYWLNMTYWWLGDSIGVLLTTPVLLCLINPADQKPIEKKVKAIILATASFLFILVLVLTNFFIKNADSNSQHSIEREVQVIENSLYRELNNSLTQLQTLASFIQSSPNMNYDQFSSFAQQIITNNNSIHAMSWNPKISQQDKHLSEAELNTIYGKSIPIKGEPLAADDPIIYVKYISPEQGNEKAIGFNVYANKARKETLKNAQNSYYPSATPIINLVQLSRPQPAYLLFIPVFQSRINSNGVHEKILKGFATGVFLVEKMIEKTFNAQNTRLFHYELYEDQKDTWFIANTNSPQLSLTNAVDVRTLNFHLAGQVWHLNITSDKSYLKYQQSFSHLTLFILQFIIVIFIITLVLFVVRGLVFVVRGLGLFLVGV